MTVAAGPILGTGIDLVEIARLAEMLARWDRRFKDRVFLPGEQAYCDSKAFPEQHYAARFAVKEAVSKAFGLGIGPDVSWLGIEVTRDAATGSPGVVLHGAARAHARRRGVTRIFVSLSHTRGHAVAQALLIGESGYEGCDHGADAGAGPQDDRTL